MTVLAAEPETEFFEDAEAFEAWLETHGGVADEVWVRMAKKATGIASLDWTRGVEVALCFGWIDGKAKRIDDQWYMQRFTPRRPASLWSKVNRLKVEALTASGRMRPAGLAEVRAGAGRRALGAGLRRPGDGDRPRRPRGGARRGGPDRDVRRAERHEPLRDPPPRPDGQDAGDARPPDRQARRVARRRRDALP